MSKLGTSLIPTLHSSSQAPVRQSAQAFATHASKKAMSETAQQMPDLGPLASSLTYRSVAEDIRAATASQVQESRAKLGSLLETLAGSNPDAAPEGEVLTASAALYSCWTQERVRM